jgi:hypothetical protein
MRISKTIETMNARVLGLQLVCLALADALSGCVDTERDPAPEYEWPLAGTGGATMANAGSGGGGTAPTGCATDEDPAPIPSAVAGELTAQLPADGCGKVYPCNDGQMRSLLTEGKKAPDCADQLPNGTPKCGSWSAQREFRVYLPQGYDPAKPYPLVIEGPGCGGRADQVYTINGNAQNTVIRVGIAPGPKSTGHATCPECGCFDDREGDDSIDWVFYERLYDKLNAELCFDRNRLFVGGSLSGGTLANELSGKYAGDSLRPVRGALVYGASLPTEPAYLPAFSEAPLAGIWVHEVMSTTTPFENTERAVTRAMQLANCAGGDYQHAQLESFPVGFGVPDGTCQRIVGCDSLYPLVVCPLSGRAQGVHDLEVNNGFSTFLGLFGTGALITAP